MQELECTTEYELLNKVLVLTYNGLTDESLQRLRETAIKLKNESAASTPAPAPNGMINNHDHNTSTVYNVKPNAVLRRSTRLQ